MTDYAYQLIVVCHWPWIRLSPLTECLVTVYVDGMDVGTLRRWRTLGNSLHRHYEKLAPGPHHVRLIVDATLGPGMRRDDEYVDVQVEAVMGERRRIDLRGGYFSLLRMRWRPVAVDVT